jgi:hypothetical protein
MNKQRKLILIAAAIGIISTFLPWFTISASAFGYNIKQSQNGFHGIGILYFLLLIAVAAIAAVGEQKERLQKNMRLAVIGAGALAVICMLIGYGNIADTSSSGMVEAGVGYGFVLSFLAALAVTAIPFIIKDPGESLASDIANLKSTVKSMQDTVITATAPKYPSNADQLVKTSAPVPDRMEELEKLIELRNSGKISAIEYEELKAKLF